MARDERGFTLVEVGIVMAVVGLLIWVALPRSFAADVRLQAAARQLQSDIRYAQEMAMTKGQRHRIEFFSVSHPTWPNRYKIETVAGGAIRHPLTGAASFVVDFNATPWTGMQLDSTVTLEFDTLGRPNAGQTISLNGGAKVVTVTAETGLVSF